MGQCLRALAHLPEDLGSILGSHIVPHNYVLFPFKVCLAWLKRCIWFCHKIVSALNAGSVSVLRGCPNWDMPQTGQRAETESHLWLHWGSLLALRNTFWVNIATHVTPMKWVWSKFEFVILNRKTILIFIVTKIGVYTHSQVVDVCPFMPCQGITAPYN